MSNEATLMWELENAIPFTCSNTTGIEKGSLCKLSDPFTAALSDANNQYISGITKTEKIANDGKVRVSIYTKGIFKMYASGAIIAGQALSSAADANFPNYVMKAPVTASGAAILGYALETAAAAETFLVMLNVGCGGNQIS